MIGAGLLTAPLAFGATGFELFLCASNVAWSTIGLWQPSRVLAPGKTA